MTNHNFIRKLEKKAIFFLFFIFSTSLFSQINIDEQLITIKKDITDSKFDVAKQKLDQLLRDNQNNSLNKVKIYTSYSSLFSSQNNFSDAFYYTNLSKQISEKTETKLDDAYTNYSFSMIYTNNQEYDKTIEFANLALKNLKKYPSENILYVNIYLIMAYTHSTNGIYSEQYENYIQNALAYAIKSNDPILLESAHSNSMLMYFHKYNKTKSHTDLDNVFLQAETTLGYIKKFEHKIPSKNKAMLYNNLASIINSFPYKNLSPTERYNLAESYLNEAFKLLKTYKNNFITATCYITFGEIQENKGNIKLAEESYLKAYPFIKTQSVTSDIVTLFDLSQLLSAFYEKTNQTDKALKYNKESLQYMQTAYEKTLENKRKFLEAYYDSENKNQEIKQLEEKNKIYTRQRILYIGIISLALAGLVFLTYLIRYRHKLNKQKTDLLESEKIETELTLQLEKEEKARLKAEKDLAEIQQEHSQKQALAVSIQLNHKNTFINELKEKVKDEKSINIDRFLKDEKIVDNNFDDLNNTIQNVHPNFFKKLASVSKNKLSNQDLKYATYIYLNMDNQRIATLLKVESKTVRMTKYRLKQKIGLQKEDSLTDFIQNLDL